MSLISRYKKVPYRIKTSFLNQITMTVNIIWATLKLVFAYLISSVFISLSGFYTIFIGLAKTAYFDGRRNSKKLHDEHKYYNRIAFAILLAGITYLFYFIELFIHPKETKYGLIISITIAFVAFCEILFSCIGLFRSKKTNDLLLSGLKFINLSSALSSLVLTQIALLSLNFISTESIIYNMATGTVVGIATICISAYMFLSVKYRFRKIYPIIKSEELLKLNSKKVIFKTNQLKNKLI